MNKINIAILKRNSEPNSLELYLDNITKELSKFDLNIQYFSENTEIPQCCNLIWEPALAMRRIPKIYKNCDLPIVASMHGVKSYSLPMHEIATNIFTRTYELWLKKQLSNDWKWFKNKITKVVAVSEYSANEVKNAIRTDDVTTLQSVKGIGAKTAQRVIIDLKDKINKAETDDDSGIAFTSSIPEEALSALTMLGFPKTKAEKAVKRIYTSNSDITVEELVKNALKIL